MQTIAIVNEKGGTGKTTTTVNLSAALGELGKKVLLVDLDGQAASSRWLGVEGDTSFADALCRGEGLAPIPDVIPGVSLAPGSGKLDSVAHDLRPTQGGQLRKLLSQANGFDYAVIDCPPSLGNRLIGNALLAATHAIVPVETSILALDGLKILLTTLEDVREGFGHDIILAGVLACRYDPRTRLSRYVVSELKRALPGKVFQTVIRENVRVRECPASGQSILTFAPTSHAAEDYRALARELLALPVEQSALTPEAGEVSPGELDEQEREAASDIRQQVDAMIRQFGPKFKSWTSRETPESDGQDDLEMDEPDSLDQTETQEEEELADQDRPAEELSEADLADNAAPFDEHADEPSPFGEHADEPSPFGEHADEPSSVEEHADEPQFADALTQEQPSWLASDEAPAETPEQAGDAEWQSPAEEPAPATADEPVPPSPFEDFPAASSPYDQLADEPQPLEAAQAEPESPQPASDQPGQATHEQPEVAEEAPALSALDELVTERSALNESPAETFFLDEPSPAPAGQGQEAQVQREPSEADLPRMRVAVRTESGEEVDPYEMLKSQAPAPDQEPHAPPEESWDTRGTGWEEPSDEPARQRHQASQVQPAGAATEAPGPSLPAESQDYPALRGLMREITGQDGPGDGGQAGGIQRRRKNEPAWRRIFRKAAGVK